MATPLNSLAWLLAVLLSLGVMACENGNVVTPDASDSGNDGVTIGDGDGYFPADGDGHIPGDGDGYLPGDPGPCNPNCSGKLCGDSDGCTGRCTVCPNANQTCNQSTWQCESTCTPSCAGKQCGDDNGCGVKCTNCPSGNTCDTIAWQCKPVCNPDCANKICGDSDGCGGRCLACADPSQGCDSTSWQCQACSLDCSPAPGSCVFVNGAFTCHCAPGYYLAEGGSDHCLSAGGTPCDGVACSNHGTCKVLIFVNVPECVCDPGFVTYGLSCIPEDTWGCRDRDGKLVMRGTSRCSADDNTIEVCRDSNGDGKMEWSFGATPSCSQGTTCSACIGARCDDQHCPLEQTCIATIHGQDAYVCGIDCDCSNCGNCGPGDFNGQMSKNCGNDSGPPTIACLRPCYGASVGCIPFGMAGNVCYSGEGCMSASPAP